MSVRPVTSIGELRRLALINPLYEKLAIIAAENLGGTPKNLDTAIRFLSDTADEVYYGGDAENEMEAEDGVVDEINFCIPALRKV